MTRSNPENVLNPDGYESADVIEKSTISQQSVTESKNENADGYADGDVKPDGKEL